MVTIAGFIIFIYSIIIHEISHGLVAERLGDPTARLSKRLTLNPIPHIDPFMSLLLPLFLIFSGSPIIFGAAKPVPVDTYNLRNPKKDMGLIGLSGPLSNLLLAVFLSLLAKIVMMAAPSLFILSLLAYAVKINIILAIFNLTPIPPLDGGRVLMAILPEKYAEALASIEKLGMFVIIFLLFFPNPFFSLVGTIYKITSLIFSLIFPALPPNQGII